MVRYAEHFNDRSLKIEMPGHSSAALAALSILMWIGKTYVVRDYMDIFDEVYCPHEGTIQFLRIYCRKSWHFFPVSIFISEVTSVL